MNPNNKRAFTITELLIAVVLLATVFMAATSFNLASYNFYFNTSKFAETQLDIAPTLDYITKSISLGMSTSDIPAIQIVNSGLDNEQIIIQRDFNLNGIIDSEDCGIAIWKSNYDVLYCECYDLILGQCSAGYENFQLSKKVTALNFNSVAPAEPNNFCVNISITAVYDPSNPIVSDDNPQVTLETSACQRSSSIIP